MEKKIFLILAALLSEPVFSIAINEVNVESGSVKVYDPLSQWFSLESSLDKNGGYGNPRKIHVNKSGDYLILSNEDGVADFLCWGNADTEIVKQAEENGLWSGACAPAPITKDNILMLSRAGYYQRTRRAELFFWKKQRQTKKKPGKKAAPSFASMVKWGIPPAEALRISNAKDVCVAGEYSAKILEQHRWKCYSREKR